MGIYTKVPWSHAKPIVIGVRRIDINNGDADRPEYSSRLVAKNFEVVDPPELFAGTPLLDGRKILLAKLSSGKGPLRFMTNDVSMTCFNAKAAKGGLPQAA